MKCCSRVIHTKKEQWQFEPRFVQYELNNENLKPCTYMIHLVSEVTDRIGQHALTEGESLVHHVKITVTRKNCAVIAVQLQTFGLIVEKYTKCGLAGCAVLTQHRERIDLIAVEPPACVVEKFTTKFH